VTAGAFKDHFSGHAADYARARPTYPEELFTFLAGCARRNELAWDCATGNGQAARALAEHFEHVIATDASAQQIEAALPHERVEYRVAPAEDSGLDGESIDLVTCAQALHWFDIRAFLAETWRVLKPGGVLAVWCYGTCAAEVACDRLVQQFYRSLDPWWPPERAIVETGYRDIELPGAPIDTPIFSMRVEWTVDEMLAYLSTWSATQRCREDTGKEPLEAIDRRLREVWGSQRRMVTWPLHVKVARKPA